MSHSAGNGFKAFGVIMLDIDRGHIQNEDTSRIHRPHRSLLSGMRASWASAVTFGKDFTETLYVIFVQPRKPKAVHEAEKQAPRPPAFPFCSLCYTRR